MVATFNTGCIPGFPKTMVSDLAPSLMKLHDHVLENPKVILGTFYIAYYLKNDINHFLSKFSALIIVVSIRLSASSFPKLSRCYHKKA